MMIIYSSTLWIWTRMSHKPCAEMRPTWDMACVWVTSKSVLFLFFCFLLITFTYSGNNTSLSKITIPKENSKAETACGKGKVPYTNHKGKVITLNIHFVLKMGKASSVFMFQPFKILFADKIYLGFFFSLFLCYC